MERGYPYPNPNMEDKGEEKSGGRIRSGRKAEWRVQGYEKSNGRVRWRAMQPRVEV